MDSCNKLSVWTTIGLLIASIMIPTSVLAKEQADIRDGGARRPITPMAEVIVVEPEDNIEIIEFPNKFSDIILVHEYDEKNNEWKLVGLRDLRRGTRKTITH